jgi:hypothetical protein
MRDEEVTEYVFIRRSTGRMGRFVVIYLAWKKFVTKLKLHWTAYAMITSVTSIPHHTRYFANVVKHM